MKLRIVNKISDTDSLLSPEWTKSPSVVDLKQELKDRPTTTVTVTEPSKGFNFFTPFKTEEQLKKAYKSLSLAYHPDRGGDTEIMKELNDQYKAASAN